jgi:hypothetical protein
VSTSLFGGNGSRRIRTCWTKNVRRRKHRFRSLDRPAQAIRSRRMDLFGDCSCLDAIEELERRSRAVSRLGGLTPQ